MDRPEAERAFDDDLVGRMTLPATLERAVDVYGDRPAQGYKGGVADRSLAPAALPPAPEGRFATLSYAEMGSIVRRLAAGFRDLGVGPGDRVAIAATTRMEWGLCDFSLLGAGAVVTTVYPGASDEMIRHVLADSGATGVVVEDGAMLERVLGAAAGLDLGFAVGIDRLDPGADAGTAVDVSDLSAVHARGEARDRPGRYRSWLDGRDPDDLASLIYTSGTTGRPKGVRLTHWNFKANVDQCRARFGPAPGRPDGHVIGPGSRTVSFLPLAHVFERTAGHFLMFASGATVSYAESPGTLRADLAAVGPTTGTSVPRVYERIYAAVREEATRSPVRGALFRWAVSVGRAAARAERPGPLLRAGRAVADRLVFSRVRAALGGEIDFLISGGGSLPADLAAVYHGMGVPVLEGYGLTETAPVVSVNPPGAARIGTIGPPVIDLEVRLDADGIDPGGFPGADGDVGELLVRGPNVAEGYWGVAAGAADAFGDDGWFRTGDVVARGPDGYLTFLERRKELLVLSTGHNVAPTPVEDGFAASELIDQCMLVGDDRPFVGALIVPDVEGLRRWARRADVELPRSPHALCADDRVVDRVGAEVAAVNESVEPVARIKRFRLVHEAFTEENGLLTPTLKKRRRDILDRYAAEVEAIYAD